MTNKGGRAFRVYRADFLLEPGLAPERVTELAGALQRRLRTLPGLTTRKATVRVPAADRGRVALKIALVYLAPDDSADERAREEAEAAAREVGQSFDVIIREAGPTGEVGDRPGGGQELAAR
jgi:hypothetical protein